MYIFLLIKAAEFEQVIVIDHIQMIQVWWCCRVSVKYGRYSGIQIVFSTDFVGEFASLPHLHNLFSELSSKT